MASFVYIFVHVVNELLINLEISGRKSSSDMFETILQLLSGGNLSDEL
jgi:hypothetical protein